MNIQRFSGAVRVGSSFFSPLENRLIGFIVPRLPKFIETYHLTLMTLPISAALLAAAYLTRFSLNWLWLASFIIVAQWFTDLLDGSLGRWRNTGLVRWGYYMDHFVDYIFLAAMLVGYTLVFPEANQFYFFLIFTTLSAFMVNSFLAFGATHQFRIAFFGIGPTEVRLGFIFINTAIIFWQPTSIDHVLLWLFGTFFLALVVIVYRIQQHIWELDKRNAAAANPK